MRARTVLVSASQPTPIEPKLREFLHYILSREGQRALVSHSAYLPLSPNILRHELERLQ